MPETWRPQGHAAERQGKSLWGQRIRGHKIPEKNIGFFWVAPGGEAADGAV